MASVRIILEAVAGTSKIVPWSCVTLPWSLCSPPVVIPKRLPLASSTRLPRGEMPPSWPTAGVVKDASVVIVLVPAAILKTVP